MELIGSALSVVVVLGGLVVARDWLAGLRADAAATRHEVAALRRLCAQLSESSSTHIAASYPIVLESHVQLAELRALCTMTNSHVLKLAADLAEERAGIPSADVETPDWPEHQR